MKRIIRLTESDLARIVRRVISEGLIGNPIKIGGATYQANEFGNGDIAYVNVKDPGTGISDAYIIGQLNKMTGYNIPTSNGRISKKYIAAQTSYQTKLRGLVS